MRSLSQVEQTLIKKKEEFLANFLTEKDDLIMDFLDSIGEPEPYLVLNEANTFISTLINTYSIKSSKMIPGQE